MVDRLRWSTGTLESTAEKRHTWCDEKGTNLSLYVKDHHHPTLLHKPRLTTNDAAVTSNMSVVPGDYVFSDPIAFRHLAQEEGTEVVEETVVIPGYQVYVVEQWACSRVHPVFVVTTFTGEESNKVILRGSISSLVNSQCLADTACGNLHRSVDSLL